MTSTGERILAARGAAPGDCPTQPHMGASSTHTWTNTGRPKGENFDSQGSGYGVPPEGEGSAQWEKQVGSQHGNHRLGPRESPVVPGLGACEGGRGEEDEFQPGGRKELRGFGGALGL